MICSVRRSAFGVQLRKAFSKLDARLWQLDADDGFTLIELVVSLGVVVLLMGVTLASFARLQQRQSLTNAGASLKNVMRDSQSRSFTGEIDCSVCNCDAPVGQLFSGWYVDISKSEFYGDCSGNEYSNRSYSLPAEIIVTPYITPPTRILFKSNPPGVDQAAIICLSHPNLTGQYYSIIIEPGGEITGSDGLVSSCP